MATNHYPSRKEKNDIGGIVERLLIIDTRWAEQGVPSELRLELNDAVHKLKSLFLKIKA